MDHPFDKWTNLLTNGPTFWQMTHVFFSRFYVWIFHMKINLDCGCLLGVGFFFFWDRGCLLGVGYFFFTVDRGCLLGVGFFEITNVWQVWSIFLRSRMFDRCGVFFWDHECLTGVWCFFWDRGCLLGVGYFFEIVDVWQVWVFLRSRMFDRCRVFFEITNVWQVWVFFWDHECLLGVGLFLRSWMFVRCGVFFFFWEMWRESLIFQRDGSWMWFGASHQKGSKVRSRIFLVHRLDRARTTELELKIVCS